MSNLRFCVIGGESAAPLKTAIDANPRTSIVSVAPAAGDEWRAALGQADVDAIAVFGGTEDAVDVCEAALLSGKHVLSSAPPARTIEEIIRIRRAESAAMGKAVKFLMPLRQHASVKSALNIATSGVLGRQLTMRGVYGASDRSPGALLRHGFHMLDLMHGFSGPFEDVQGMVAQSQEELDGAERNAFAVLRTNKGVLAQLHVSTTSWRHTFRLELGFERGYLWLDGLRGPNMDFAPEMFIIGRVQTDGEGRELPNPDEEIHEMTDTPTADETLTAFLDAVDGGSGGWLGTTKQVFDAINTVQRIYALDHSWDAEA
ncbi:MAG: hypothetical protein AAFX03_11605 [Pseudomonadota bacterium]